jgi:hypothetical protein
MFPELSTAIPWGILRLPLLVTSDPQEVTKVALPSDATRAFWRGSVRRMRLRNRMKNNKRRAGLFFMTPPSRTGIRLFLVPEHRVKSLRKKGKYDFSSNGSIRKNTKKV